MAVPPTVPVGVPVGVVVVVRVPVDVLVEVALAVVLPATVAVTEPSGVAEAFGAKLVLTELLDWLPLAEGVMLREPRTVEVITSNVLNNLRQRRILCLWVCGQRIGFKNWVKKKEQTEKGLIELPS